MRHLRRILIGLIALGALATMTATGSAHPPLHPIASRTRAKIVVHPVSTTVSPVCKTVVVAKKGATIRVHWKWSPAPSAMCGSRLITSGPGRDLLF
jgi:hypothetical protein